MAGCFGNSAYDRYLERQLYDYLDSLDNAECPNCGFKVCLDDFEEDEEIICPKCETTIEP